MWWNLKRGVFVVFVRVSNFLFGKELIHRSRLAKWLNQCWEYLFETLSPVRRRQARFERENPTLPWFVPKAIEYIEGELRPDFVGFEWGSGRSTIWFARRVCHITSVEGRRSWFEKVKRRVEESDLIDRVTLRLVEISTDHNFNAEEIRRYAESIFDVADRSLDFVVVDGHFRAECLRSIGNKLRPGGLLVIDNSEVIPRVLLDSLKRAESFSWNNGIWETTVLRSL